jgi:hypothetical protein
MCLNSSSFLFNPDFESLDEMDKIRVYPVGTLQICLELQFHRLNVTNSVCDSAKSGHPRVTTQCQDNVIIALSLRNQTLNVCTFSHELRTTAGVSVSDQTICNHLRKTNIRPRRPAVHIPLLSVIGDYVWNGVDAIFAGPSSVVHCLPFGRITIQLNA